MATFTSCPARSVKKTVSPMEGPIESPERRGDCVYKIARPIGKKPQWVHFDRLKPYVNW